MLHETNIKGKPSRVFRKNNQYQDTIDLSSHYLVLGSGLSAIAAIHGIMDTCDDGSKKIFVVDAGITKNDNLDIEFLAEKIRMPSPKFRIDDNRYVYESFKSLLKLTEDGFKGVGSLAKGGLSNIWGATIQPYSERELFQFPYSYQKVKSVYSKIYGILTNSDNELVEVVDSNDDIEGFVMGDPLLAITERNSCGVSCHLKSCYNGCIYCNKNIFNSGRHLDDLMKSDKIEYMSGLFIESVIYDAGPYIVKCRDIYSGKNVDIKATAIYSCLGAISTTKVALGLSKKDVQVPLLTTPGGAFFIYSLKEFHKINHNVLSSKSFRGDIDNVFFEGNIFPFSKNLVSTYFGEKLGMVLFFLFGKLVFSRLFIANIFFSSDLSFSSIFHANDQITIKAKVTSDLKIVFKDVMKLVSKQFFSKGLFVLPFGKKLLKPGEDIHYGGSIPMKAEPKENECDLRGELYSFKNFYVTDSSSMPFLAPKGHSFNSMVNSYYIARESINNKIS